MKQRKIFFSDRSDFFSIKIVNEKQEEMNYYIFFELTKAKNPKYDIIIRINSAHYREKPPIKNPEKI